MDGETLATMGVLSNNGMTVACLGHDGYYRTKITDLLEIITELQTELDFTVTLYSADIDIETNICTFRDIKTKIYTETDIITELQLEQNIKTRLIRAFEDP